MSNAYAQIAFTPKVRELQTQLGSRENYAAFDHGVESNHHLSAREADFISQRDSFYQATVSETGWPYVQFRGGPIGFLKVLDATTVAYADFRGNMQYISVGNLGGNDRVSIILMDYANRARLKLLGRVRIVGLDEDPELIARLESPHYRARIQRAVVVTVDAFDWNCPQHITPRYTEREVAHLVEPLREEITRLRALSNGLNHARELGVGAYPLEITAITQLTPRVRAYALRAHSGVDLPELLPGASVDVPVRVVPKNGGEPAESTRRYSLSRISPDRKSIEIAVLREDEGNGGSIAAHRDYQVGMRLRCNFPANDFEMSDSPRPALLLAGGIGITPLRAMAAAMKASGRAFKLHYWARSTTEAAYAVELQADLQENFRLHTKDQPPVALGEAIAAAPQGEIYVCGPQRMIDEVREQARSQGYADEAVHFERFGSGPERGGAPVTVVLQRSGRQVVAAATQSILEAVEAAGVTASASCRNGTCGACAVRVLAGTPIHHDRALTSQERDLEGLMCICVSRASGDSITLDL